MRICLKKMNNSLKIYESFFECPFNHDSYVVANFKCLSNHQIKNFLQIKKQKKSQNPEIKIFFENWRKFQFISSKF